MTIAETLAERIAAVRYDALPEEAVHWARSAIIDTVGCTLAGATEPCARIVARVTASGGPCLIFGTAQRVAALDAALINGTASHALDLMIAATRWVGIRRRRSCLPCSPSRRRAGSMDGRSSRLTWPAGRPRHASRAASISITTKRAGIRRQRSACSARPPRAAICWG